MPPAVSGRDSGHAVFSRQRPTHAHQWGVRAGRSLESLLEDYLDRNDEGAMAELVARTRPRLLTAARRIRREEAEDAVQAAYLSLVRRRDASIPVHPWLLTAVIRLSYRQRAKARRLATLVERLGPRQSVDSPLDAAIGREEAQRLRLELWKLPSTYRDALVLHYLQGLSIAETSQLLQLNESTLRTRLERGRLLLRSNLRLLHPLLLVPWFVTDRVSAATLGMGGVMKANGTLAAGIFLLAAAVLVGSMWSLAADPGAARERASDEARRRVEHADAAAGGTGSPRAAVAAGEQTPPGAAGAVPSADTLIEAPKATAPTAGSVDGRLLLDDGTPLPGIALAFRGSPASVVTDEQGRFHLAPAASFALAVPGATTIGVSGPHLYWLSLAERDDSAEIRLEPGFEIGGTVRFADTRAPVRDQYVRLRRSGLRSGETVQGKDGSVHTDEEGHWRFSLLPAGAYEITIERDGFEPVVEVVPAQPGADPIEIVLKRARDVVVRFEKLPEEWKEAPVYLLLDDVGDGAVWLTYLRTIADGRVTIPCPPPGRYWIGTVPAAGYPLPQVRTEFEVQESAVDEVVLALPRSARIAGVLLLPTGEPLAEAILTLQDGQQTATDAHGAFLFAAAPLGANRISLRTDNGEISLKEIDVPATGRLDERIVVDGTSSIRGRLLADGDRVFHWLRLEHLPGGGEAWRGSPSDEGRFLMAHLRAGEYRLRAGAQDSPILVREISLHDGETLDLGDLALDTFARVPVEATFPDGASVPQLVMARAVGGENARIGWIRLDGTGKGYLSGLPAGTWTIHLDVTPYAPIELEVVVTADAPKALHLRFEPGP